MNGHGKSDSPIVPEKEPNNEDNGYEEGTKRRSYDNIDRGGSGGKGADQGKHASE